MILSCVRLVYSLLSLTGSKYKTNEKSGIQHMLMFFVEKTSPESVYPAGTWRRYDVD